MRGSGDDAARTLPAHERLGDDTADWRIRSSGRIGACIDTKPFPDCLGERGCGRALPRNAG